MKKWLITLLVCGSLFFGFLQVFSSHANASAPGYTFCLTGPQCHPGMTNCGPQGLNCYCHWFVTDACVRDVPD